MVIFGLRRIKDTKSLRLYSWILSYSPSTKENRLKVQLYICSPEIVVLQIHKTANFGSCAALVITMPIPEVDMALYFGKCSIMNIQAWFQTCSYYPPCRKMRYVPDPKVDENFPYKNGYLFQIIPFFEDFLSCISNIIHYWMFLIITFWM